MSTCVMRQTAMTDMCDVQLMTLLACNPRLQRKKLLANSSICAKALQIVHCLVQHSNDEVGPDFLTNDEATSKIIGHLELIGRNQIPRL